MRMVHQVQTGKRTRMSFSRIKEVLEMPNLIEIQKKSYQQFLDVDLKEVLRDVSPINDYTDTLMLEFLSYSLDGKPKYDIYECKNRDTTYASTLKVLVRLTNKNTGEVKEQEVFMGDFPLMTEYGSFIINGAERVVVSQLVRSPGVYYKMEVDKTGKHLFFATVIPNRGAWLEYETDSNDILWIRVDRTRKLPLTVVLRALGLSTDAEIVALLGEDERLTATLEKDNTKTKEDGLLEVYRRLRPGEPPTVESATTLLNSLFYDAKRYDLARVGRYKFNKKLSLASRCAGFTAAENVVDPVTGEVYVKAGEEVTVKSAEKAQNAGVNVIYLDVNAHKVKVVSNHFADPSAFLPFDLKALGILEKVHYPTLCYILAKAVLKDVKSDYTYREIHDTMTQTMIDLVKFLRLGGDHRFTSHENIGLKPMIAMALEKIGADAILEAMDKNLDILRAKHIFADDVYASVNYHLNLNAGIGETDDIDHLGNRRLRSVGELLQNQIRIGFSRLERVVKERMAIQEMEKVTPQSLINIRPVSAAIKEFFGSSQLSQFMDQPNPLAELAHKRRLSALGPGGLNRERASFEVRDVHHSHYGRMCPIETPEGPNIGLIGALSTYAKVNEYGFMEAPYRIVDKKNKKVTENIEYMTADVENRYVVAQANEPLDEKGYFVNERVVARIKEKIIEVQRDEVDLMDVSPRQVVSVAAAMIPFLENDDANRALMGSNMQRQAVPLLCPEAPLVGTGIEHKAAKDSGVVLLAKEEGIIERVTSNQIVLRGDSGEVYPYNLQKFMRSNQGTCINQRPLVKKGQRVAFDEVIADGPSTDKGEIALGRNVLIGFMTWEGYNYEDAILINERLVRDDVFTSIHIDEYECEARDTKLGAEEITRDISNVGEDALKDLDERGVIRVGASVKSGDILVGKVTPKGETELTAEERLLRAIFGEKAHDVRDTSLRVPHGEGGIVVDVKIFTRENKDELSPGTNTMVRVYIAQKRKISVGDKMAGRHGNKGVISRVLPSEDMPFLPDGTPLDIVLNPLGVPSRMNIGQVLEVHLGLAAKALGWYVATPVFEGATDTEIADLLEKAGYPRSGKTILYDGRSGEAFENPVTVGYMYILKLAHLVDDKIHARSTGPYSLVTQQPLGGKAQFGGQRFGEMEVWALEAYGAAHTLQEILTVKSDDVIGRVKTYEAIVKGENIPEPGIPESLKVLIKELQSLALDVRALSDTHEEIQIKEAVEDEPERLGFIPEYKNDFGLDAAEGEDNEEDEEEEIVDSSDLDNMLEIDDEELDDVLFEEEDE